MEFVCVAIDNIETKYTTKPSNPQGLKLTKYIFLEEHFIEALQCFCFEVSTIVLRLKLNLTQKIVF